MKQLFLLLKLDPNLELVGNPLIDWAWALGLGVLTFATLLLLRRLLTRRASHYLGGELPQGVRLVSTLVRRTQVAPLFALSLIVGTKYLDLPNRAERITTLAIVIMIGVQIGIWMNAAVRFYLEEHRLQAGDATAATTVNIVKFVAALLIWTIVILVGLANLGINISAALTGLGIGGVAVALATQNILSDLFASLSIALDKPFMVGDTITVGTHTGAVESVGVKSTRLRSTTGEQVVISNADMLKSRLLNYGRCRERRRVFTFRVAYETPVTALERVPGLVEAIVARQKGAQFERCTLRNLGEAALEFEVSFVSLDPTFEHLIEVEQAINLGLLASLPAAGVVFVVVGEVARVPRATVS